MNGVSATLTSPRDSRSPRSQTPFGNALAGETPFHMEGASAGGAPLAPEDTPAWGTEFPSQVRSQTEFGDEGACFRLHRF